MYGANSAHVVCAVWTSCSSQILFGRQSPRCRGRLHICLWLQKKHHSSHIQYHLKDQQLKGQWANPRRQPRGSSSSSDCIDCLAGRYVEDVGSGSLGDCIGCVAGKYAETSGNTAEYAVAESCSADLGSSVLSDSDLLEYVDVVEGVVADGFVVEVDTGYRNLTVDQCQAVCSNISVCAAVTWLHPYLKPLAYLAFQPLGIFTTAFHHVVVTMHHYRKTLFHMVE